MVRLSSLILLAWAVLASAHVSATDLMVYSGTMNHSAVGGCCKSGGMRSGAGVLGNFELKPFGDINLSAFTDGRWSEGIIAKPFYVYGRATRSDAGAGDMVQAVSISDWRWITSLGAGYFTHTTRKVKFDLATQVSGFVFSDINQLLYSINDRWAAGAIVQFSLGISASDTSLLVGTFLNVSYTFK